MGTRFCPNCGSENVSEDDETQEWECLDCDFRDKIFPEKQLLIDAADVDEEEPPVVMVKKSKKTKVRTKKSKARKK